MTAVGAPVMALHGANDIRPDLPVASAELALDKVAPGGHEQLHSMGAGPAAPGLPQTIHQPALAPAIQQEHEQASMQAFRVDQEAVHMHTKQGNAVAAATTPPPPAAAAAADFESTPIASPAVRPVNSPSPAPPLLPLPASDAAANLATLPELQPLAAPDASEPATVHAEYEAYMQRFRAGDTLAQRWHRLAAAGKLGAIREEWEDWQHDLMLQQLQQQIGAGRGRGRGRGKRDEVELLSLEELGPRKSRQRRAPSTLQDYQVDTPVSASPAPGAVRPGEEAPTTSGHPSDGVGGAVAAEGDDESLSNEDADAQPARRAGQQQQQRRVVQHRVYRPPNQPTQPYTHQVYRSNTAQQPQQPWSRWVPSQAQQLQQQQQQAAPQPAAAAPPAAVTSSAPMLQPELIRELYQIGAQLGASVGGAGRGAGGQLPPAANTPGLAGVMEQMCARMFGGDSQAMMQQLATLFAQQQQQQH